MEDKNKNLNEELENNEVLNEHTEADDEEEVKIDVAALSEKDAKNLLKSVLESNEAIIRELNATKLELEKSKSEALDNKDKWYRAVAEFENFKKRNQDTRKNAYYDGQKEILLKFLVVGDSIERALSMEMDEKTREGVTLIARQFTDTLSSLGVTEINPLGEVFDPTVCEAIHTVPKQGGEEGNVVKTVFKKGYKLADKIIRYCQVVVTEND